MEYRHHSNKTSDAVTYLPPFENIIFWVEIFNEIALSLMVKENGRYFWKEEMFLKIRHSILLRYPVGRKF